VERNRFVFVGRVGVGVKDTMLDGVVFILKGLCDVIFFFPIFGARRFVLVWFIKTRHDLIK
jgi:hypothetical protein